MERTGDGPSRSVLCCRHRIPEARYPTVNGGVRLGSQRSRARIGHGLLASCAMTWWKSKRAMEGRESKRELDSPRLQVALLLLLRWHLHFHVRLGDTLSNCNALLAAGCPTPRDGGGTPLSPRCLIWPAYAAPEFSEMSRGGVQGVKWGVNSSSFQVVLSFISPVC